MGNIRQASPEDHQANHSNDAATSVARSSLVMAAGTFVSRILGMVRSPILLTMVIGLNSPIANAFDIANTLPNIMFGIVAGGLINAVLVPAIVAASERGNDGGAAYINKIITLSLVALAAITVVLTLAAPLIVKIFASTMNHDWYEIAVYFAYWCIPQVFFYGLYTVLGQILNARESFGPYTWVPVANNIVAILGLLLLLSIFGTPTVAETSAIEVWQGARLTILAVFSTAGIAAQALLLILPLRRVGIHYRPDFQWRGVGLRSTGEASLWALLTAIVLTIPLALQTNVAAGATQRALEAGMNTASVAGNAAFSASYTLAYLPISLFALSIATAMFPKMSAAGANGDVDTLRSQASVTANTVSAFNFLCVALYMVLAVPLARVFVPSGTMDEITALASVVMCLCPAIIGKGIMLVFNRVCYSLGDTRGIFITNMPSIAISCVLYVVLCARLPPHYTTMSIALVSVLDTIINTAILLWYINRKIGAVNGRALLKSHIRMLVITIVIAVAGFSVMYFIGLERATSSLPITLFALALGATIVTALFALALKALRVPEYTTMEGIIKGVLRKFRRVRR